MKGHYSEGEKPLISRPVKHSPTDCRSPSTKPTAVRLDSSGPAPGETWRRSSTFRHEAKPRTLQTVWDRAAGRCRARGIEDAMAIAQTAKSYRYFDELIVPKRPETGASGDGGDPTNSSSSSYDDEEYPAAGAVADVKAHMRKCTARRCGIIGYLHEDPTRGGAISAWGQGSLGLHGKRKSPSAQASTIADTPNQRSRIRADTETPSTRRRPRRSFPRKRPLRAFVALDVEVDVGGRAGMEDRVVIIRDLGASVGVAMKPTSAIAVFDGHGGFQAAEFCQRQLPALLGSSELLGDAQSLVFASLELLDQQYMAAFHQDMDRWKARGVNFTTAGLVGTTAVLTVVDEEAIHTGWIGDSEAWLYLDGGRPTRLMRPHSPLRPDEFLRILRDGGFVSDCILRSQVSKPPSDRKDTIGRVGGILSVSRAVGDFNLKQWILGRPEVETWHRNGTESFIVVASDGLWGFSDPAEVGIDVMKYLWQQYRSGFPRIHCGVARFLLERALMKHSDDNISVAVAFLKDPHEVLQVFQ